MGKTIYTEVELDLTDYEDEIEEYYCNPEKCLGKSLMANQIREYIIELDKDLHIYLSPSKRTLEQVCYDLMQMIKE